LDCTRYAFISLGANLPGTAGHPLDTIKTAIEALRGFSAEPLLVSVPVESDPKDCPPGSPRYCNAVVGLLPDRYPNAMELLLDLQMLENRYGRQRTGLLNEARSLDLDILVFPGQTSATSTLMLPHPRAHERRFVLEPWITLVGEGFLLQGQPLGQWLSQCTDPPLLQLE